MKSAVNSKNRIKAPVGAPVSWTLLKPWLVSLGPPVLVVLASLLVFLDPIIRSIASTPHPELVYAIFAAFFLAIGLCAVALYQFQQESIFINDWRRLESNEARRAMLEAVGEKSGRAAYPALLAIASPQPQAQRQAKFEHELSNVEAVLADKVSMANYLAGALVGLGLVGTFVGLLGTLEDLGAVFGSLSQAGDSTVNPTEVFANMVQKLQDPMKGMGTAFVSSLYGLLGSLIVGLCALSVSKSAIAAVDGLSGAQRVYGALECAADQTQVVTSDAAPSNAQANAQASAQASAQLQALAERAFEAQLSRDVGMQSWAEASEKRLTEFFGQMLKANWTASDELVVHSQKALHEFKQAIESQGLGTELLSRQMTEQRQSLVDSMAQIMRQINEERVEFKRDMLQAMEKSQAEYQREITRLEQALTRVAGMSEKSVATIERHMAQQDSMLNGLPKTQYWKEAWSKVQHFLHKSRLETDLAGLAKAVEGQTAALDKLSRQLALEIPKADNGARNQR